MYPKIGNKSQIVASQDFISNFVIGVCSKSNHKLTSKEWFTWNHVRGLYLNHGLGRLYEDTVISLGEI